ncbi:sugar kinase [uncultured Bacteroides sp.]|uniref:sugar kinase n=1 Tax=uncultured Bacteroides sp. TaxID=162156 RepID=UPI002AA8ED3A|nr:sugar kinase [uncultured Bacteroides sp.]
MKIKNKVVTFGEVLLRLTAPGNLRFSQVGEFIAIYGGSEANVAVSLANYGVPVEYVTRLPDNDIARACVSALRSHNLGTEGIVYGGNRLGIYFLENGAVSRSSSVVYDRADSSFSTLRPGMIDWKSIFADASWFHWSGIAASLTQGAADVCREAIETANEMGLTISCDLNYRRNLWKYGKSASEVMPELVQYSDVIFGSEGEYMNVLNFNPVGFKALDASYTIDTEGYEEACRQVQATLPRCRKMFIELRNSVNANHDLLGGILYSDGTVKHARIYDVTHVVDKVGTGDAFVGGMIYGLLAYPNDEQKALDFALAASCLKTTIYGDFNLATVAEVETLMKGDGSGRVSR